MTTNKLLFPPAHRDARLAADLGDTRPPNHQERPRNLSSLRKGHVNSRRLSAQRSALMTLDHPQPVGAPRNGRVGLKPARTRATYPNERNRIPPF